MVYRILEVSDLGDRWGLQLENGDGRDWYYFFLKEHHPVNPNMYTFASLIDFPSGVKQLHLDCTFVYENLR